MAPTSPIYCCECEEGRLIIPACTCQCHTLPERPEPPRKPEGDAGQRKTTMCIHSRTHADCESCRQRNAILAARSEAERELLDECEEASRELDCVGCDAMARLLRAAVAKYREAKK